MASNNDEWSGGSSAKDGSYEQREEARGGDYRPRQNDRQRDYDNRGSNYGRHYEQRDNNRSRNYEQRDDNRDRSYGQRDNNRRNHEFNDEMEIRSDQIGRVIGRGGANIKRIQSEFNVHIDIDKNSNKLTVSGGSNEIIADAISEIKNQLSDDGGNRRQYGRDDNRSSGRYD